VGMVEVEVDERTAVGRLEVKVSRRIAGEGVAGPGKIGVVEEGFAPVAHSAKELVDENFPA